MKEKRENCEYCDNQYLISEFDGGCPSCGGIRIVKKMIKGKNERPKTTKNPSKSWK